jgi:hypothetical protein
MELYHLLLISYKIIIVWQTLLFDSLGPFELKECKNALPNRMCKCNFTDGEMMGLNKDLLFG